MATPACRGGGGGLSLMVILWITQLMPVPTATGALVRAIDIVGAWGVQQEGRQLC
jgi:hypothetical protein